MGEQVNYSVKALIEFACYVHKLPVLPKY